MSESGVKSAYIGDKLQLIFAKHIDENCDFSKLELEGKMQIELEFKNVQLINSLGVKKTLELFSKIDDDAQLELHNCPVVFINQLNIFPGLFGSKNATITSFAIPYYCENCDVSTDIFVSNLVEQKAPEKNCETCNTDLELDDFEDVYFSFLKSA